MYQINESKNLKVLVREINKPIIKSVIKLLIHNNNRSISYTDITNKIEKEINLSQCLNPIKDIGLIKCEKIGKETIIRLTDIRLLKSILTKINNIELSIKKMDPQLN